ncbi:MULTISPECIES: FAD-dependent oxidoreductase [Streptomyces]|uniref:Iron-sulfur binding oxidoreductase n=1 Tax=Streptomyces venezuelae (strain ATCC 10712 / CBS 650.69 / DSM 40230 / JCM 4526 / NBRC 13096 / PD 04745) TaxID=953739 RepID=F2RM04_STRVP|nr:FAD-dependent oxidoreductase [Streptomyces venezuelae]APE25843.1 (2Fe-2S)-binding protein [Streptomyces venezuelae]QES03181.1 FAD-dependent oxidoreductase [Streptomyces venezuelae ATCC 10712]CCA60534.1 iron-sulfur binding oxidoreductase [Streptomyces venezuelae ATCC 10712]
MTQLPDTYESYWMETGTGPEYPALTGDLDVDVAVIGAGVAGISTAWELGRAGARVALLEADRLAAGVTGHTTAKLSAQHGLLYARLRKSFGAEGARQYAQSQQEAVDAVEQVATELGIDCELERVPAFVYMESADAVDQLRAEAEAAREAGLTASVVSDTDLPYPVAGAVRAEHQAQFHPRKYLLALVADLVGRGGVVHERTRIVSLDEGEPCRLTTEGGAQIVARDVVVATHYPVFDRALMFSRLEPHRELVVAGILPADQDPHGMYLTQERNTRSVRTAPYGEGERLLIVTGEKFKPGVGDVSERHERLAAWTEERFPDVRITHRWAAQDNTTTDGVPFVGPFHPGSRHVYVAAGFGGWGMSSGVMSGRLLCALITGGEPPWASLYDPRRLHPREAPSLLKVQGSVLKHFVGDRLRSSHVDTVDDIPPGAGALVRVGGRKCAVYRDESGATQAVSARCTHLGCLVLFNDAERAWECPCHGSRFAVDGSVLQGPAVRPLEPRPLPEGDESD